MTDERNRREFTRIPIAVEADIQCAGDVTLTGVVSDLSLNGLFLESPTPVPAGTNCAIRLRLNCGGDALIISAHGEIIRSGSDGVAISFEEVDADSFEHLRNLVLYNSPDPDRVSDEFLGHLGIKRR